MLSIAGKRTVIAVLFLLPALLLAQAGLRQFRDGWARDAALPVPNYLLVGHTVPKPIYEQASAALAGTDRANGETVIAQAESAIDAGAPAQTQIPLIEQGLSASPASARGWMLLAFAAKSANPALAGKAAYQGFLLAPYDYWLAGVRSQQAIGLWDEMDSDTRAMALSQTRMLWETPELRGAMMSLLSTAAGAQLVTRAFAGRQAELLNLNRWALMAAVTQRY